MQPQRVLSILSASQLASVLQNNPDLRNIPAFGNIVGQVEQLSSKNTGCKACNKSVNPYQQLKPIIESALNNLSEADFLRMKSILNLDQICYFKKDQKGVLTKTCL